MVRIATILFTMVHMMTLLYQDDLGNEPNVYPNYTKIRFDNKTEMPFIESVTNRSVIYTTYKNADTKIRHRQRLRLQCIYPKMQ